MADAFEVLRAADPPMTPDPEFARRLRARIERALTLPKGVTVSDLQLDLDTTDELLADPDSPEAVTAGAPLITRASITPYLAVSGAAEAIDWYRAAFGARLRSDPIVMDDGRIGHAEIEIGGALIMLADEFPDIGHTAPTQELGVHVSLHLSVGNVDEVIDRAVAEGAALERPAADFEYGRSGTIRDPFGHRWQIMQENVSVPRHGDIGYVSLWVPDSEKAATFFSRVLGWEYAPPRDARARQVQGLGIHHGIWGGVESPTLFCCFAVDDMAGAISRVVQAGGTAGEPQMEPYGEVAECTDDQGVQFAIYVPPGGVRRPGASADSGVPPLGPQGEVAYVTMEVPDSERTRAFYATVLGWRFQPGRVDDGWQVEDVAPMVGVSGGHAQATTIPLYAVDDIEIAAERVREAGGTATSPEVQPYGTTSTCTDDQGTRFYLGQF